ncbi:MAG: ABC transporter ATP-binding protein [Ruminococcaceae bacterium]|nr:ABC transporter ATP-binding protein [Oscillospiraceae bacterium]
MNDNKFNYTYSAPTESERREIDSIRRQYQPKSNKEISLNRLRRLDSIVKGVPQAVSLALGVVGTLVFGLGLTMILLEWAHIALGILVMVVALPLIIAAYPTHNRLLEKYKEKYGREILQLSEELLNEKQD